MNQIERVELIKAVFKRLYVRFGNKTFTAEVLRKEEIDQLENEKIEHIIGRGLLFSKRMAMCRMFRHWYHSKPEYIGYNTDMFFISYLDKKGWLNTQKIMNQMTDSRIKAILGEGIADKLINDDKSKDNIRIIKERLEKIKKKYNIESSEEENEI